MKPRQPQIETEGADLSDTKSNRAIRGFEHMIFKSDYLVGFFLCITNIL